MATGTFSRTLGFNRGDVLVFIACLLYAGYTIALPQPAGGLGADVLRGDGD